MREIIITKLQKMDACIDAVEWTKQYNTFDEAWNNCDRGHWMLWLIGRRIKNIKERKLLVLCACQCARLSLKYVKKGEKRPRQAIETAEKWANNVKGITIEDVKKAAASAASSAAYAAYAAAAAASSAAYAAYAAADAAASAAYAAAYAAYAAADAADAAASAAYASAASSAAYAAYAAYAATRRKTFNKCAEIVREFYPSYKF